MAEIRTTELSKAVSYYAQFLGLTLEALPEESAVRFVFTQIDPAQASREYYFVLANTPSEEEDPKVRLHPRLSFTLLRFLPPAPRPSLSLSASRR